MTDAFLLPLKPLEPGMDGHSKEGLTHQLGVGPGDLEMPPSLEIMG